MRLLVSWLRDFVDVPASAEEIADTLGLRGFEVASLEPVPADLPRAPWQTTAGPDSIIDFEITANRPDCLSVVGLAREVATSYNLPLVLPSQAAGAKVALAPESVGESDRLKVTLEAAALRPRDAAPAGDLTPAAPSPPF